MLLLFCLMIAVVAAIFLRSDKIFGAIFRALSIFFIVIFFAVLATGITMQLSIKAYYDHVYGRIFMANATERSTKALKWALTATNNYNKKVLDYQAFADSPIIVGILQRSTFDLLDTFILEKKLKEDNDVLK